MFVIRGFEWDKGNAEKNFLTHQVTPEEAEEVFFADPVILRLQDQLYSIYGKTQAGRHLYGVFLLKPGRVIRVISIRDMDKKERRFYTKKKGR